MLSPKQEAELEELRLRNIERKLQRMGVQKAPRTPDPVLVEREQSGPVRLIDRSLKCKRCGKPRPAGSHLCLDCFGVEGKGGVRNRKA